MTALLFLIMGLIGCNGETANIAFPFEVGDIEMYHYAGVPASNAAYTCPANTMNYITKSVIYVMKLLFYNKLLQTKNGQVPYSFTFSNRHINFSCSI